MNMLEWATPVAAAVALAFLWIAEAVFPLFHRGKGSVRKARHFALAGMNAGVATLFSGMTLAVVTLGESMGWGLLRWLHLENLADDVGPTAVGIAWGLLALVLLDGWHYGFHVLAHKTPFLWKLHAVHHTDPDVDVTTAMRFHCGEIAMQCLMSLPVFLLLGVGMTHVLLYNLVLLPVALFHHANVNVPERVDRPLRWLIVTPRMHIVHHSKWTPETDSNFAAVLSIWDRVFGTFRRRPDPRTIELGLDGFETRHVHHLRGMLAQPLSKAKSTHGTPPEPEHLSSGDRGKASEPLEGSPAWGKIAKARGSV
jgi:sterol desaturase/sphingolipid hydroxylase (fatty acid hydroxylase superfamily)